MSLPILITNGSPSVRKQEALKIAEKNSSTWDTHILNGAEEYGIANIKDLLSKVGRKPFNSLAQSVVILEAQNLTLEAQNALLKTLEEPSASVEIILTSPTAEGLLSTIASRCLRQELTTQVSPTETEKLKKLLSPSFYERWAASESLDTNIWLEFWRKLLITEVLEKAGSSQKEDLRRLTNYLKLVVKLQGLLKRRASQKLIKNILLIQAPIDLAAKLTD